MNQQIAWGIKYGTTVMVECIGYKRKHTIRAFEDYMATAVESRSWSEWRKRGYSVVKVEVREVGAREAKR